LEPIDGPYQWNELKKEVLSDTGEKGELTLYGLKAGGNMKRRVVRKVTLREAWAARSCRRDAVDRPTAAGGVAVVLRLASGPETGVA
jgi:hypothetical protein